MTTALPLLAVYEKFRRLEREIVSAERADVPGMAQARSDIEDATAHLRQTIRELTGK